MNSYLYLFDKELSVSYKKLRNFKIILDREDFNFISDHKMIETVEEIIQNNISTPDGREAIYTNFLNEYLEKLTSFSDSISGHSIPDIKEGFPIVFEELQRSIKLLSEQEYKRKSISKNYCKKFKKSFLSGLSKLLKGIRAAFDPDIVSSTKIDTKQYVRYILDKVEGLGTKILFNKAGRHAFVNKVDDLNMQELIVTARFLVRPSGNQIRTINGWTDFGLGKAPVRILSERRVFRKDKVYFLYRLNEHSEYETQLQTSPDRVVFLAA